MPHSKSILILAVLLTGSVLIPAFSAGNHPSEALAHLKSFMDSEDLAEYDGPDHKISDPEKWVLETGELAAPFLASLLLNGNEDQRLMSTYFLSLIGTPQSRDLLKQEYGRNHDVYVKTLLGWSMGSTADEQDIDFLISSLEGEQIGDEWPPIEGAALMLGALRIKRAVPALRKCASADDSSIASNAAEYALQWITGPTINTPQSNTASKHEQIILAMFRSGIPRTDESHIFYEKERNLKWVFHNDAWKFQKVVSESAVGTDVPSIYFDVYISHNESRAIAAVGMTFGPLNGKGYHYLLNRGPSGWRVVGILSTWIS